jgi:hypothetical protein
VLEGFLLGLAGDLADDQRVLAARFSRAVGAEHVDTPTHRCRADGRHHAGGAARKFSQHGDDVARIGRRFLGYRARIHIVDWADQIDEGIEHMQPGTGHPEARRLAWVIAPATGHAGRVLVGEMTFNMHHLADDAIFDHALELAHRGKAALVIAAAERHAGRARRGDGALSLGPSERQRLLAPNRFAGSGRHLYLLDVQRMRRGEQNRLHFGISDRVLQVSGEPEAMLRRQLAREFRFLGDAMHDAQTIALALN